MRSLILKIHMYAGLLCSSYLLIFGVTSLNYNHKFGKPGNEKVRWERSLKLVDMENTVVLSEAIRDTLGLIGQPLPWETHRDDRGNLRFGLERPGKHYTIHVLFDENQIRVEETRKGFWAIVNSLHAFGPPPSSPSFLGLWDTYTELCTWVVLFSAASGVYFWTRRPTERFLGWILLGCASGTSLVFMVYVWLRG
jgi:hypothetical protein